MCVCSQIHKCRFYKDYSIHVPKKCNTSHKKFNFELLDFWSELLSIQVHYYFLDKLESVLQVTRKAEVKRINEAKQHNESQDITFQVAQNLASLNNDSYLWFCKISCLHFVNPHDCGWNVFFCILNSCSLDKT